MLAVQQVFLIFISCKFKLLNGWWYKHCCWVSNVYSWLFSELNCSFQLFSLSITVFILEIFGDWVEIWFTCLNLVGKTSILRKSLFFFLSLLLLWFFILFTVVLSVGFLKAAKTVKQVGLRAFSSWQALGWPRKAGCWGSRFLSAVARACCTGKAGGGHGHATLGPHSHVVFGREIWVQAQDNED